MTVGADGKNLVLLRNAEYTYLQMEPGEHQLFVQANCCEPSISRIELKTKERRCFRGFPNPTNAAKAVLGIFFGQLFLFEEGPCPTPEQLSKYSEVKVKYLDE